MATNRTQVLSYGGGVQTVAMIAAIAAGQLEKPDLIVIADTDREKSSTWDYMEEIVQSELKRIGLQVEIASHDLATVDLYAKNDDLLLPAYTETGKMPTFCSNEWKQRVIYRWLRGRGVTAADIWIGFSTDEAGRAQQVSTKWIQRRFPLLELGMNRADCRILIESLGWPLPMKSACFMCPNMTDSEWVEMKNAYPNDFDKAVEIDDEIWTWDGVRLHSSFVSLRDVEFHPERTRTPQGNMQCSFGYCFL